MSNQGKTVKAHYRGTLDDGTQFDSSYDRGEPIEFVAGAGQMIKGFDAAVLDMEVGEKKTVHIPAAEAYGERSEDMIIFFPADQVPEFDKIEAGMKLFLQGPGGMPVPATLSRSRPRVSSSTPTTSSPAATSTSISSSSRSPSNGVPPPSRMKNPASHATWRWEAGFCVRGRHAIARCTSRRT